MRIANLLNPRLPHLGKIRIGDKVKSKSGKPMPNKLNEFRLTTEFEDIAAQIAEHFGTEYREWNDANAIPTKQFEVYIKLNTLEVVLIGDQPPSYFYEKYAGGTCTFRSDGEVDMFTGEVLTGRRKAPDSIAGAKAWTKENGLTLTTRIPVLLPFLTGLGTFTFETRGWNSAELIMGAFAKVTQARAQYAPATMHIVEGAGTIVIDGKKQKTRYKVIQFIFHTIQTSDLLALEAGLRQQEIEQTREFEKANQPKKLTAGPRESVDSQLDALDAELSKSDDEYYGRPVAAAPVAPVEETLIIDGDDSVEIVEDEEDDDVIVDAEVIDEPAPAKTQWDLDTEEVSPNLVVVEPSPAKEVVEQQGPFATPTMIAQAIRLQKRDKVPVANRLELKGTYTEKEVQALIIGFGGTE